MPFHCVVLKTSLLGLAGSKSTLKIQSRASPSAFFLKENPVGLPAARNFPVTPLNSTWRRDRKGKSLAKPADVSFISLRFATPFLTYGRAKYAILSPTRF